MLFNSVEFLLLFLPLFLAGFKYACRPHSRLSPQHWVVASSFCFYAYWDWRYLPLLIVAIIVNHAIGTRLLVTRSRPLLAFGVALNLGVLGVFKYVDFFLESAGGLTGQDLGAIGIVLPLAISFTTFEHIAFLVDSYRGNVFDREGGAARPYSLSEYALLISYFPQLIAGPIFHHREMLPQFVKVRPGYVVAVDDVSRGIVLIVVGLFKKVVIADSLARWVGPAFEQPDLLTMHDAWTAVLGYSLQLYFDFSAYCEVAMGLGLLTGIRLPVNFLSPYKSFDIQEFWRRWHITLGRWLKEYLYIPLGGSKHDAAHTAVAVTVTFVLGGLWHGAGWQFVVWGAMHASYIIAFRLWRLQSLRLHTDLARALTLLAVVLAWVPFRADGLGDALRVYSALFGFSGTSLPILYGQFQWLEGLTTVAYSSFFTGLELWAVLALLGFVLRADNVHEYFERDFRPGWRSATATGALACGVAFYLGTPSAFLNFQF